MDMPWIIPFYTTILCADDTLRNARIHHIPFRPKYWTWACSSVYMLTSLQICQAINDSNAMLMKLNRVLYVSPVNWLELVVLD